MTNFTWKSGVNGDWSQKADWTPGTIPSGTSAEVTIAATGSFGVTIATTESFTVDSVTLNNAGATLDVFGFLGLGGPTDTLLVKAGDLNLGPHGTIANGTINASTGTISLGARSTLQNIAFAGTLNVTGSNYLYTSGFLHGLGTAGGNTINIVGNGLASVKVLGSETIDDVGINLGAAGQRSHDSLVDTSGGAQLTFGSQSVITANGNYINANYLTGNNFISAAAGGVIVNNGTINAQSGELSIEAASFTNAGAINVTAGAIAYVDTATFTNTGTINVSAGSELLLNMPSFINAGAVLDAGAVDIAAAASTNGLGQISTSGAGIVNVTGSLNLASAVLAAGGTDNIDIIGTVANGTIAPAAGTLVLSSGATLQAITVLGNLNLAAANEALNITGGLTVETASGANPGTINITGPHANLQILDSETLNNVGITLGVAGAASYDALDAKTLLTLGAQGLISNAGYHDSLYGTNIYNAGTITGSSGRLYIDPGVFTNAGTVNVNAGAYVAIDAGTFRNTGMLNVSAGGELLLGTAPPPGSTGTINAAGTFVLAAGAPLAALGQVTTTGAGVFEIAGSLDLGGGVLAAGGSDNILIAGTVADGTINSTAGTLTIGNATLQNITDVGNLTVTNNQELVSTGGLTVETSLGGLPGTIYVGDNAVFDEENSGTLNNIVINLGAAAGGAAFAYDLIGTGGVLSLGTGLTINSQGGTAIDSIQDDSITGTIVDAGVINVGGAGLFMTGENFLDTGTINVAGGALFLENEALFTNAGTLNIGTGGDFDIIGNTIVNTGTIMVGAGSALFLNGALVPEGTGAIDVAGYFDLGGNASIAELSQLSLTGAGVLDVLGSLDLGNTVLALGGTNNIAVESGGTLANGTVNAATTTLALGYGATLQDITYIGALTIANGARLDVANGIAVETSLGLPGTIAVGDNAILDEETTGTLNNAVINLGSSMGNAELAYDINGFGGTLTFGAGVTINSIGTNTTNSIFDNSGTGTIINDGLINAGASTLAITGQSTFINAGTIDLLAGGVLQESESIFANIGLIAGFGAGTTDVFIAAAVFEGFSSSTLTTGTFEAAGADTLALSLISVLSFDDADIILSGTGSEIESFQASNGQFVLLESSLLAVGAGGTLNVLGGRGYTTTGSLNINGGTLNLGGGTFMAGTLSLSNSLSALTGFGTVKDSFVNAGTITAAGGNLDIAGAITGGGALLIGPSATLELGGTTAESITFSGSGATHSTLILDATGNATGVLNNFAAGDTLDLAGATVTAVSTGNTTLAITLSSGTVLHERLKTAIPAGDRFGFKPDGATGSDVVLYREATASLAPASGNFGDLHTGAAFAGLTITNTQIADGYSEGLDASFSSFGAGITAGGNLTTLAAGAANSSALTISFGTDPAGTISSSAVVTFSTDGAGTDGDAKLGLGSQTIAVTGTLFNYATASTVAPSNISFGEAHVGAVLTQQLTLANSAVANGFSENLDAGFSGTSSNLLTAGAISELAAGATNNSALSVTLATGTAGVQSGSTTLGLISDGSTIDTLGTTTLGSQTVAVSGTLFNYATAAAIAPVNFGIVHVGDTVSQAIILSNSAAPGGYSENLDASLSGTTGVFSGGGSVSELAAGASNTSALLITFATGTAGVFGGTSTLGLVSDGSTIDTLGTTVLNGQTITLTGTVNSYATASVVAVAGPAVLSGSGSTLMLNFGSFAQGSTTAVETLGVLNSATGPSDNLSGSFVLSGTSGFTDNGFGAFSGLAAGSADTAPMITLSTGTAGTYTETIVVDPTGSNASGYSGALAPETIIVTGTVGPGAPANFATASAITPNPLKTQGHVGTTVAQYLTLSNTAVFGSENLDARFSGTSSDLTGVGSLNELAAGATSTNALDLVLQSTTAGVETGNATIALFSDGSTIDSRGTTALSSQTVSVTGTLFNYATASTVAPINFGIVHVGQSVSRTITLTNTAATGKYSENLDSSFSGTTGSFSTSGSVNELKAGSKSGALAVTLQTGAAGTLNGATTLGVISDGSTIDTLGTTVLSGETIALTGTVNNYATATVEAISGKGTLNTSGTTITLNFGTVVKGSGGAKENLGILNSATGPADQLSGSFVTSGTTGFTNAGLTSFNNEAAGTADTKPTITLNTGTLGTFTETIIINTTGANGSGYQGTLAPETLIVTGTVAAAAAVTTAADTAIIPKNPATMNFIAPAAAPASHADTSPRTGSAISNHIAVLHDPHMIFGAAKTWFTGTERSAETFPHGLTFASAPALLAPLLPKAEHGWFTR